MNYVQAVEKVKESISYCSEADLLMVFSFAEVNVFTEAIQIVAENYADSFVEGRENMSVREYILDSLEKENKIKDAEYYEEAAANNENFYWVDELRKWVKLA